MPPRILPFTTRFHRLSSQSHASFIIQKAGLASRRVTRPPPFPTVKTCPSPTCGCADTPLLPDGLAIDKTSPMNGVIGEYAEQVLVCTGRSDWISKIEEENAGDNLAADLRELFGKGGEFADPFHHVSVVNSSFPSSVPPRPEVQSTSAYLLPSFKYVPFLPRVSFDSVQALAKGYLLPPKLHAAHDGLLSPIHRDRLTREEAYQKLLPEVQDVRDVMVLICGHGGRDLRCGLMGPVLGAEFERKLAEVAGLTVMSGAVQTRGGDGDLLQEGGGGESRTARVGLISHIGGHKFAGNVIIYIPPGFSTDDTNGTGNGTGTGRKAHPLAGMGIWYGRVEPKHVEGLVRETVMKGNVVEDHFRGGIDSSRKILRL